MLWLLKQLLAAGGILKEAAAQAGNTGGGISLYNPLGPSSSFTTVANNIISFLLEIGIPVAAIMIVVGGIQMMTAGGQPEKFSNGKKTILYAVIGLSVLILGKSIVSVIQNVLK